MSTKQQFLKSLELHPDLSFIGDDGYVTLDDDRRARVSLTIRGNDGTPVQGHWNGVTVQVVSKTNGPIASQTFAFDSLVSGRADDRATGPDAWPRPNASALKTTYEVIDHCGWKWYIAVPSDISSLQDAVTGFVELFR